MRNVIAKKETVLVEKMLSYQIKKPTICNRSELYDFKMKVVEGGQVNPQGLEYRIRAAKRLAFCYENDHIAGIAALKNPNANYKQCIFRRARVAEISNKYELELGWVVTTPQFQGQGIAGSLVQKLIKSLSTQNVFATTKANNLAMKKILKKCGFITCGNPYSGDGDYKLLLYIRSHLRATDECECQPQMGN